MAIHVLKITPQQVPLLVCAGWSEDARGYFLAIETDEGTGRGSAAKALYDSRKGMGAKRGQRTFDPFLVVLQDFGITLPAKMLSQVVSEGNGWAASRSMVWTPDGACAALE